MLLRKKSLLAVLSVNQKLASGQMISTAKRLAEIETRIRLIRGASVLFDADLAKLYGVTVSALLQAVRRNKERFPSDFVFQLTNQELRDLKSQTVISSLESRHGGRRVRPYAFTEQGIAMLSSVLRSAVAVQVNIEIMRAFIRLRRAALVSRELMKLIEELSTRLNCCIDLFTSPSHPSSSPPTPCDTPHTPVPPTHPA